MACLLMRGARQLLTLRGLNQPRRGDSLQELGLISDGTVLIRDGVIEEVGPSRRVENLAVARGAREIDVSGRVVMPGFVDSHTHLVHAVSWLEDCEDRIGAGAEAGRGLQTGVQAVRNVSARRLELGAEQVIQGMVRHGTTTLEAKSGFGLDQSGELKILRVIGRLSGRYLEVLPTFLSFRAIPNEYRPDLGRYLRWISSELMPKIRRWKLAAFVDIFCDHAGFNPSHVAHCLDVARNLGFLLKVHTDQFHRIGGARLAVQFNAVSADHLDYADDQDIGLLARSDTIATLLPGAAFYLGTGRYAPARAFIDAGAAVALGTDFNPDASPTYSMQMIVSLACSQMGMTPAEAITAATINGAHAIRRADRVGSLEPGKDADLIVLNVSDYREIPYHFGVNQVRMTVKRGVVIYEEGKVRPSTPGDPG